VRVVGSLLQASLLLGEGEEKTEDRSEPREPEPTSLEELRGPGPTPLPSGELRGAGESTEGTEGEEGEQGLLASLLHVMEVPESRYRFGLLALLILIPMLIVVRPWDKLQVTRKGKNQEKVSKQSS